MTSPSLFRRILTAALRRSSIATIRNRVRPLGRAIEQLDDRIMPAFDFGFAFGIGGNNPDEGKSVATDAAGNVYVTGYFNTEFGAVDFDPAGTSPLPAVRNDAFVAKYTSTDGKITAEGTVSGTAPAPVGSPTTSELLSVVLTGAKAVAPGDTGTVEITAGKRSLAGSLFH